MASKKLLVADDSLTIQKVIRLALANEGYEIQAISDGNDAVQHISLFQPDLVLIDVSLPGKSAFEVKRAVNQEPDLAHTRFILMSSAFERVDEAQAAEVDFHGRLTKPFDPGHLREVLQQVFNHNAAADRPAATQNPFDALGVSLSVDDPAEELPIARTHAPAPSPTPPPTPVNPLTPPPVPRSAPPAPQFTPPPQPQSENEDPNADIRELTETTIRMSGLNEFEWSVQEPSLKPPRSLNDTSEFSNSALEYFKNPAPVQEKSRTSPFDPDPTESFGIEKRIPHPASTIEPPAYNLDLPPIPSATPAPAPTRAEPSVTERLQVVEPDPQMIEEMVSRRVEEALQKTIQKMLPDLAEKLIKEQIRQMLSEQP